MVNARTDDIMLAIKNGKTTRKELVETFPRSTLDYNMNNLKMDGFVKCEIVNKEAVYSITEKGNNYMHTIKNFDGVDINIPSKEIMQLLKNEITNQIIIEDETLLDMFVTIPFCYGAVGRNSFGLMPMILSSPGRGKTILVKIYQEITENTQYIDCKDILTQGGIENRFKHAIASDPDILVVDEFSQIWGSKLTALQSLIAEHEYPVLLLGNPSTHITKYNYKETPITQWVSNINKSEQHTSRSFLDRVNLHIYFPDLKQKKDNDKRLLNILFDDSVDNLTIVGAYLKQQKNKNPKPNADAVEYFAELIETFQQYMQTNPEIDIQKKVIDLDGVPKTIRLGDLIGYDNQVRFKISLAMLARGIALRDNNPQIVPDYFRTSFSWYFYFAKQLYGIDMLAELEKFKAALRQKDLEKENLKKELAERNLQKEKKKAEDEAIEKRKKEAAEYNAKAYARYFGNDKGGL